MESRGHALEDIGDGPVRMHPGRSAA
jgi:hypothetical protein